MFTRRLQRGLLFSSFLSLVEVPDDVCTNGPGKNIGCYGELILDLYLYTSPETTEAQYRVVNFGLITDFVFTFQLLSHIVVYFCENS